MNEQLLENAYAAYCQELFALRKSGDWKAWHDDWADYVKKRWGLSKSRAKLLCDFAQFRGMCEAELFGTLPETPEQVKALLALPKKRWLETWEMILSICKLPILPQNVESAMEHFGIYANKKLPPDALKAIRVRRASKTLADVGSGEQLVQDIGPRALGKHFDKAVEVVIDAHQARLNSVPR